ncbi:HpaII family restriction endonuclease [Flavobacterium sp. IB48]|uniref:HpaII family restriction endonuclease n=1 Tax=Flavobacterium sp. IB48 TaxID=2779375 RepID=UPI0018E7AB64|nr:HpaII family restriction endonuclease [Flavobacterium sp. IB48]MBJ2123232.1 HpaII family restriction endonuclease [Flavobacterium sp. IB48]
MITGNKGEWSEPYVLLKLLIDRKLYLGDENFNKIKDVFYPILQVVRHEKNRDVNFTYNEQFVVISDGVSLFNIPLVDFILNTNLCFEKIKNSEKGKGSFGIPEIESFLASFSIKTLKAKSKLKNDITIQIEDRNSIISPTLGFSVKSQLGRPATLVNASGATNFTYLVKDKVLTAEEILKINNEKLFSNKIKFLNQYGAHLEFEKVDNPIFTSNLQTIDSHFSKVLAEVILYFYENNIPSENTISKFIGKVSNRNLLGYDLDINSSMYEMMMKKFLTDYALGMRASEVWKRNYQATGGYLVVKNDGELLCYHFYFAKNFEDYLFNNTKLETGDVKKHNFGYVYTENNQQKIKLNLQIRFKK